MNKQTLSKGSEKKDSIVRMNFNMPFSLRKAFKLQATYDDRDMKQALYELMQGYVAGKFKLN